MNNLHLLLSTTVVPAIQPMKNRLSAVFLQATFSEIETHPSPVVA
ncbi:hypothetical protein HMPREF0198_0198 [Cardiobacterium hominis ATCC 15826]|uniref:Uncharacterized protein n=1 Tax=Cardiobacterium hominis (strain ATCC 15826 / DSM 8339 / NCTC 10426 / 6573) TaxID=638300 RepID=C8N6S2_CARH6|nr:hypothetical protein HMPREF0198_0198 [Cardiobacterium hominis ATCC 15826]